MSKAAINGSVRGPQAFRPLSESKGFAPIDDDPIVPAVPLLFFLRGPPAVSRLVIAVCVDALDRQTVWPLAHVGEEVREPVPPITDRDATRAVMTVALVSRILAAGNHSQPNDVRGCSGVPVLKIPVSGYLPLKTSARPGMATAQLAAVNGTLVAAITATVP